MPAYVCLKVSELLDMSSDALVGRLETSYVCDTALWVAGRGNWSMESHGNNSFVTRTESFSLEPVKAW